VEDRSKTWSGTTRFGQQGVYGKALDLDTGGTVLTFFLLPIRVQSDTETLTGCFDGLNGNTRATALCSQVLA